MHIAIMGSGGLGGVLGARLAATGARVSFIARGAHLEAMRAKGLRLESELGDVHLKPADATDDPGAIGPVDIVIFTVKCYDTDAAAISCKPLLRPDTAVVTFQNGVDSVDVLSRMLGAEHVVGGTAVLPAAIAEPGTIRHMANLANLAVGELDGTRSARVQGFVEALSSAGFDAKVSEQIQIDVWQKFIGFASWSGTSATARANAGTVRAHPITFNMLLSAVAETAATARAEGIAVADDIVERNRTFFETVPAAAQASTLTDLQHGRRLETPWINGTVVRLGQKHGIPTPTHAFFCAALAPHVDGAPSST
jgi:2-dehydropantoate 2-reductase